MRGRPARSGPPEGGPTPAIASDRRRVSSWFETGFGARLYPYLLVLPAFIIVVGVVIYPVLSGIWYAFHDVTLRTLNRGTISFVGLRNFERAFADPVFAQAAWNTVAWVVLNVVAQLSLGLSLALLLNRPRGADLALDVRTHGWHRERIAAARRPDRGVPPLARRHRDLAARRDG
jgi:ABC-type sugar transport system permease subunit